MMNNMSTNNKLRVLAAIIILVIGHIIAFQVIWVKQTYERSEKAIRGNLQNDLEAMVGWYKNETADSIRGLLKKIVQRSPSFNYMVFDNPSGRTIGYRYENHAYVTFKLNSAKTSFNQNEAYEILQNELNYASLSELSAIYSSLIGTRDFSLDKSGFLAIQLMNLVNNPYGNMVLFNKIVKRTFDNQTEKFTGKAIYLKDIDGLDKQMQKSKASAKAFNGQEQIVEVISAKGMPLDEKLKVINTTIEELNAKSDLVYVAKPLFDDANVSQNQTPVILLAVKLPSTYALKTMLNLAISLALLMLFLGISIIYMFNTILKQKRLAEIKDDFISNVSHELKTPVATTLAAIQGMQHFEVLNDKNKTNQYLSTAANEMHRLSDMIDNILNSAIYERHDFNIHFVIFNLKEMLGEIVSVYGQNSKKDVSIILNYDAQEGFFGDKAHLYHVFINLIDNAIKYGKEKVDIKIECLTDDHGIKILVADNGNGIPMMYHKNIFEKFFRVPNPGDHSVKGYGLGLNFVKNIIEKHNGVVRLVKSDEEGSIFEINLPQ